MCMIDNADEPFTAFHEVRRRARREHKCNECGRTIGVGESYHRAGALYDSRWTTYRTCAHCDVLRQWVQHNCGGFLFHAVLEDFREHAAEYRVMSWWKLSVMASNDWRRRGKLVAVPSCPSSIAHVIGRSAA